MTKRVLYYLLILPISSLLLLEAALQAGSLINGQIAKQRQTSTWLTPAFRVITLGDSNTYGLYLESDESYPKQLEKIWNEKHPNKPIEVINLGYPGANSSRIVANLEDILLNLQPDIVTIMVGTNDSWTMPITEAEYSLSQSDNTNAAQWLKSHSKIYRLYCLIKRPAFREEHLQITTTSDPSQSESAKNKPATIDYGAMHLDYTITMRKPENIFDSDKNMKINLEKLINFSANKNQRILFLTYPGNKGYYKNANKIIIDSMKSNNYYDFIDVTDNFLDKQPPKGEGNEFFFSDLHATAIGNSLVAKKIAEDLENLLSNSQRN